MKLPKRKSGKRVVVTLIVLILATACGWYFFIGEGVEEAALPAAQTSSSETEEPGIDSSEVAQFAAISEQPVRMVIDKIGVDASIVPVGLTPDGLMDAPNSNDLIGWYKKSAKAGEADFSMLLDGHHGTEAQPAVFSHLYKLENSDIIQVYGNDGSILKYKVVEMERQYAEDVDMEKALYPYREDTQSLTIITCEGVYDAANNTYDKRVIVYAERIA